MQRSSAAAGNKLLVAPDDHDHKAGVYSTLSHARSASPLLVVSYREGPDTWLTDFRAKTEAMPDDIGFIDVGGTTRSAAAASPSLNSSGPTPAVTAVSNPADLTELGIQISTYLKQWAETAHPVVIYFDSLTALLEVVNLNRAYRFLHVLAGRVTSVDGTAYYRLNPDAHDSQTVAVLQDLMDDRIELSTEWSDENTTTPP